MLHNSSVLEKSSVAVAEMPLCSQAKRSFWPTQSPWITFLCNVKGNVYSVLFYALWSHMSNSNIVQRILYLSLASLLEFPINGLIGRQHDKHLNAHVEDGHGDQVRHVVPEVRRNYIFRPSFWTDSQGNETSPRPWYCFYIFVNMGQNAYLNIWDRMWVTVVVIMFYVITWHQ